MTAQSGSYPARLDIDYPEQLDRFTTFFRLLWAIPVVIVVALAGASSLWVATAFMIAFRVKYPRWWFDFAQELARFETRVGAYLLLLTDAYPSADEEQSVHLDLDYPDAAQLNRFLPLVKWFLALPHYIVLAFLWVFAVFATLFAWFAILFTGRYPRGLFDFVLGVMRWSLRVMGYAFLMLTDEYPPFSLK